MDFRSACVALVIALSILTFEQVAQAGVIQDPVWSKDTEKLGYYKITSGEIITTETHNPGTSKSPNEFWEVTVTALVEKGDKPESVRVAGDMSHITAVTGHKNELDGGGASDFDLTATGNDPVKESNKDADHLPNHKDYFGFKLKAVADDGEIKGTTFAAVGYHPDGENKVTDEGNFDFENPFQFEDVDTGTKWKIDKNNSSDSGYKKTIFPNPLSPINLALLDYSFEFEIGDGNALDHDVFDAMLTELVFEFIPFTVGGIRDINYQVLDTNQPLTGLFDQGMERLILPAQTLWLNTSGEIVGFSDELFIFDFLLNSNGDVQTFAMDSKGSFTIVPEPSTVLLLGSGLVGLVAYRRKTKSNSPARNGVR